MRLSLRFINLANAGCLRGLDSMFSATRRGCVKGDSRMSDESSLSAKKLVKF
jgi:hypothetical protein